MKAVEERGRNGRAVEVFMLSRRMMGRNMPAWWAVCSVGRIPTGTTVYSHLKCLFEATRMSVSAQLCSLAFNPVSILPLACGNAAWRRKMKR